MRGKDVYYVDWKKEATIDEYSRYIYSDFQKLVKDSRINLDLKTNSLVIDDVKEEDAGSYTCKACVSVCLNFIN